MDKKIFVIGNLKIAADNPVCTHGIVGGIFEKIQEFMSEQGWESKVEDLYIYDVVCDLDDGRLDKGILELLKEELIGLCEGGYIVIVSIWLYCYPEPSRTWCLEHSAPV